MRREHNNRNIKYLKSLCEFFLTLTCALLFVIQICHPNDKSNFSIKSIEVFSFYDLIFQGEPSENSMECRYKEDESEHTRIKEEQEKCEKQSVNEILHLEDFEYARNIKISKNFKQENTNMMNNEIKDD